ncbi:hypothetical protein NUSPORA_02867 [Nucleospora cyclopteri]
MLKNLIKTINQHAISVINYHVDVLKLEPSDFLEIDHSIKQVLVENTIYLQHARKIQRSL